MSSEVLVLLRSTLEQSASVPPPLTLSAEIRYNRKLNCGEILPSRGSVTVHHQHYGIYSLYIPSKQGTASYSSNRKLYSRVGAATINDGMLNGR